MHITKYSMRITVIEKADTYPVSMADIKEHLRILHTDEDDLIESYLAAANEWLENETNRSYSIKTYFLVLPSFGRVCQEIPYAPLQEIESIQYYKDGTLMDYEDYRVIISSRLPAVIEPEDSYFPTTDRRMDAVQITFTAGYTPEDMPILAKHAIKILVGAMYENREAEITGTISKQIELGLDRIIHQLRVINL